MSTKSQATMSAELCRLGIGQYVNGYGDQELADISADMLIKYRLIASTDTQPRDAQITQDPIRT